MFTIQRSHQSTIHMNEKEIVLLILGCTVMLLVLSITIIVLALKVNKAFRKGAKWADAQRLEGYSDTELKQLCLNYWAWRHHTQPFIYEKLYGTPFKVELDEWFNANKKTAVQVISEDSLAL